MNKRTTIFIGIGIAVVVLLGILATRVGGVSIRRVQPLVHVSLDIQSPLLPGVQTKVRWDAPTDIPNQPVNILLRTKSASHVLASTQLFEKEVFVTPPCHDETSAGATMSLVNAETKEILSWQEVELLPSGPDCF